MSFYRAAETKRGRGRRGRQTTPPVMRGARITRKAAPDVESRAAETERRGSVFDEPPSARA